MPVMEILWVFLMLIGVVLVAPWAAWGIYGGGRVMTWYFDWVLRRWGK